MTVGRRVSFVQRLLEGLGRAEGGAHQQELRALEDEQRDLPGDAALPVRVVVELVDDDAVDRLRPCPRAAPCSTRISAVQQMIGASRFTDASPVIIPTRSAPKSRQSAKNFSLTSALMGAV